MSSSENDFITHRAQIVAEIARQRGELAAAYRDLEKPIRYTEYGMRGFGFLRSNPWIFVAVPAVFSVASNLLGLGRKPSSRPAHGRTPKIENEPKGLKKTL